MFLSSNIETEGGENMAGINAEHSIYNQLMDVMERLEKMETASAEMKLAHREERDHSTGKEDNCSG